MNEDLKHSHHGRIYDNFLMHYKYVKREKIAGAKKGENQWKYYYKDDDERTNSAKESVQNTLSNQIAATAQKIEEAAEKTNAHNPNKNVGVRGTFIDKIKDLLGYDEKADYERKSAKLDNVQEAMAKSKERLDKAHGEYADATSELENKKSALEDAEQKEKKAQKAYDRTIGTKFEEQRKSQLDEAIKERKTAEKECNYAQYKVDAAEKVIKQINSAQDDYMARIDAIYGEYQISKDSYETTMAYKISELHEKTNASIDAGKKAMSELLEEVDRKVRKSKR